MLRLLVVSTLLWAASGSKAKAKAKAAPERFEVIFDNLPMTADVDRDSTEVGKLSQGTIVNILEKASDPIDNRIRALVRARGKAGWITIRSLKPSTDETFKTFAKPVTGDTIEADSGDPKPGEGEGGVAVLMKPMPEATTMKTWTFLKASMVKIGEQVKTILQVRDDMALLQKDLSKQEKLWHQAEIKLNQENAEIRSEIEKLKAEVKQGAKVKRDLMRAKELLEEEEAKAEDHEAKAEHNEKMWKTEVKFLEDRKTNVTELHKEVNESATKEMQRVEAVHLQLNKDAVTMKLASEELEDRKKITQERMHFENEKSLAQQAELKRQIAAMEEGLKRIQGKLKPRHVFDEEEIRLKQELRKATDTILSLQAEQQQIVSECSKELKEHDALRCVEEQKVRSRQAEKTQFCNAIQVQHQVLIQDLQKCNGLTIVGPRINPAEPAGVRGPIFPVHDPEAAMVAAGPSPAQPYYLAPAGGVPI